MMFGLKEIVDPIAAQLREANETLVELLRGINAEQRRTNALLEELIREQARPKSTRTKTTTRETPS